MAKSDTRLQGKTKMINRRMSKAEIEAVMKLFGQVQESLHGLSGGDAELLFAMRRRLYVRLIYEERGTPTYRTKLKAEKWKAQNGLCAICKAPMDQKGSELDRTKASLGYTDQNTRLVHHDCHIKDQASKKFTDS